MDDELDIVIGDERFAVHGSVTPDGPYSSRLDGNIQPILEALKKGNRAILDRPQHPFTSGFDTIPLRGSNRAISALQENCGVADAPTLVIDTSLIGRQRAPFADDVQAAALIAFERELTDIANEEGSTIAAAFDAYGSADILSLGTPARNFYNLALMNPVQCGMVACSALVDLMSSKLLLEVDGMWFDPLNSMSNGMQDMLLHGVRPQDYTVWSFDGQTYDFARELPASQLETPYWLKPDFDPSLGPNSSATASSPAEPVTAPEAASEVPTGTDGKPAIPGFDLLVLADLPPIDATSPNARGVEAYDLGQYADALQLFLEAAEAGDTAAKTNAAIMLVTGKYVPGNQRQAIALLEDAADLGDGFVATHLGAFYAAGQYVSGDFDTAIDYFKRAIDTVAAPEAAYLYSAYAGFSSEYKMSDVSSWLPKVDELCDLVIRSGHRMGIVSCEGSGSPFASDAYEDARIARKWPLGAAHGTTA